MISQKQLLVPVLSVVTAGAILFGAGTILVHAQTSNAPLSGLAKAIASKFDVNQAAVQTAITAYMQQQRGN